MSNSPLTTGYEIEAIATALPIFAWLVDNHQAASQSLINIEMLQRWRRGDIYSENGPPWGSVLQLMMIREALRQSGQDAVILEHSFEEAVFKWRQHDPEAVDAIEFMLRLDHGLEDNREFNKSLIGLDATTRALNKTNREADPQLYSSVLDFPNCLDPQNLRPIEKYAGFEINSPICQGPDELYKLFIETFNAIQPLGIIAPSNCSVHQHVGVSNQFTSLSLEHLTRVWAFFSPVIRENIFPLIRRDSEYCVGLTKHINTFGYNASLLALSDHLTKTQIEQQEKFKNNKNNSTKERSILETLALHDMAEAIQAYVAKTSMQNQTYSELAEHISNGTVYIGENDLAIFRLLRRYRYFDLNIQPIYTSIDRQVKRILDNDSEYQAGKKGKFDALRTQKEVLYPPKMTVEFRWMAVIPEMIEKAFHFNYTFVQQSQRITSSRIYFHQGHPFLELTISNGRSKRETIEFAQTMESLQKFMGCPNWWYSKDELEWIKDASTYDHGIGDKFWPQARVPDISTPPNTAKNYLDRIYRQFMSPADAQKLTQAEWEAYEALKDKQYGYYDGVAATLFNYANNLKSK